MLFVFLKVLGLILNFYVFFLLDNLNNDKVGLGNDVIDDDDRDDIKIDDEDDDDDVNNGDDVIIIDNDVKEVLVVLSGELFVSG